MRAARFFFWAYVILLIFEGALRKWLLPSLSDPLLIIRDPLVFLIFGALLIQSRLRIDGWWLATMAIALLSLLFAAFAHANPIVAAFGLRTNYLHLLLLVSVPTFLFLDDVTKIGKLLLWLTPFMTALLILQFFSPKGSWINIGPGGHGTASFDGAAGYSRSSGTFSFISGLSQFYTIVAAFVLSGFSPFSRQPKWLLITCTVCLCLAIPMSISRFLLISVCIVVLLYAIGSFLNSKNLATLLPIGAAAILGIALFPLLPGSNEAATAFSARWKNSTTNRGGVQKAIVGRVAGGLSVDTQKTTLLGAGLGAGSQIGSKMLRKKQNFALGEAEWDRVMGELGLLLGPLFLILRVALFAYIFARTIAAARRGNLLAICLAGASAPLVVTGQWGQPTTLGFTALSAGLALAACNPTKQEILQALQQKLRTQSRS